MVSAVARDKIEEGEILLVVPEAVRFSRSSIAAAAAATAAKTSSSDLNLKELIKKVIKTCSKHNDYFREQETALAVVVMFILAKKKKNQSSSPKSSQIDSFILQAATWPSEDDMKHSSIFYWDESKLKKIWNQSRIMDLFQAFLKNIQEVFDEALFSLLKNDADEFIDYTLPSNGNGRDENGQSTSLISETTTISKKEALRNTFVYAFSLIYSRSHSGDSETNSELIPLVELFNGTSTRVDEHPTKIGKSGDAKKSIINVELARGKWPFMRGGMFIDECNLPCSAVFAKRPIKQGEELIIDYGELSPLQFVIKYGFVPEEFLTHHDIRAELSLWFDPSMLSNEHSSLRVESLRKHEYDLEKLLSNEDYLVYLEENMLEQYSMGNEPDLVLTLRHVLILTSLADDYELQRHCALGVIRGPLYTTQVLPLMCKLIDYNLEKLCPGMKDHATSAKDIENARKEGTPHWEKVALYARVVYRENLIMWRHAIAKRAGILPHYSLMDVGCNVCGRTFPSMRCSRCKVVTYCSRNHQMLDWKNHKKAVWKIINHERI